MNLVKSGKYFFEGYTVKASNHLELMVFSLYFFFIFVSPTPVYSTDQKPYKIGVNLELTGPWANITQTLLMAMEMEVDRINRMGGVNGHLLELFVKNNGFDIATASGNMLQFVRDESILAVVGPFEDNFQATTRAIAQRERITNIIVCPSNPRIRALKQKWAYNIAHNDQVVSQKLVELCIARGYKKVLVFHGNWPLAQSLAVNFKRLAEKKAIHVIISKETHKPTGIDTTPQLIKLKAIIESENIDAFYASTGGPTGPIICKNMRTLGINIPILGTHAFGFEFIIDLGGDAVEGVEFPSGKPVVPFQLNEDDPVRQVIVDFHKRMISRYKIGSDQISGHGYDIVWLIHDALKRCQGTVTRSAFREAMENTKDFKGCTGTYNYSPTDHDGLSKKDMVFVRIENHKFLRIKFPDL